MAMKILSARKSLELPSENMVVPQQQYNDQKLGMHPAISLAAKPNAVIQPEPEAKDQSQNHEWPHKPIELTAHKQQPFALCLSFGTLGHHGQIDIDAWQIKQPSEPTGHKDNMKGLDPEHRTS